MATLRESRPHTLANCSSILCKNRIRCNPDWSALRTVWSAILCDVGDIFVLCRKTNSLWLKPHNYKFVNNELVCTRSLLSLYSLFFIIIIIYFYNNNYYYHFGSINKSWSKNKLQMKALAVHRHFSQSTLDFRRTLRWRVRHVTKGAYVLIRILSGEKRTGVTICGKCVGHGGQVPLRFFEANVKSLILTIGATKIYILTINMHNYPTVFIVSSRPWGVTIGGCCIIRVYDLWAGQVWNISNISRLKHFTWNIWFWNIFKYFKYFRKYLK